MKNSLILVIAFVFTASCELGGTLDADSAEISATRRNPIVGGMPTSGDLAVVLLATQRRSGAYSNYCTGTLVGAKTVLTAAHCINAMGQRDNYYVGFGSSEDSASQWVKVVSQTRHPNYSSSLSNDHDFGVIQLETPVLNVVPIEMNPEPLEGMVGKPIRHVGFGVTSANAFDSGLKREVTYNVRRVEALTIESGASGKQTCSGDSGGPAFMITPGSSIERVVGVVSYGDAACTQFGVDGRVDAVLPWIRQTMNAWEVPTCNTDGLCLPGCAPIDVDCACAKDGVCTTECADFNRDPDCPANCGVDNVCSTATCPRPDTDCLAIGTACLKDNLCRSRVCVNDAQNTQNYCSMSCLGGDQCPSGMECASGACRFVQKPVRRSGETCLSTDYCEAGICAGPSNSPVSRCVRSCSSSSSCATGESCEGSSDGRRFCRAPSMSFEAYVVPTFGLIERKAIPACTVAGGGPLLMGLAMLLVRRRRRA